MRCKIVDGIDSITFCTRGAQYYLASAFDKLLQTSFLIRAGVAHTGKSYGFTLHIEYGKHIVAPRLQRRGFGKVEHIEYGVYKCGFSDMLRSPNTDDGFHSDGFYCCHSAPVWQVTIRESVVADFVYLPEVVEDPNNNKRCDAPHFIQMRGTTRLLWRHPYKMKSAVRCPVILKLPHFRQGQCENTFLCLCRRCFDLQHNKDINIFANKQHSTGHRRVFNLYVTANSI